MAFLSERYLLEPQTEVIIAGRTPQQIEPFTAHTFVPGDFSQIFEGTKMSLIVTHKHADFIKDMAVPCHNSNEAKVHKAGL